MTSQSFIRRLLIFSALTVSMGLPSTGEAAGFLDWLFPLRAERRARRRAMTTYRPVYGGVVGANYGSGGSYPTYGTWNGLAAQPTVARYAPTTAYRTVWTPVPVTSYRPTSNGSCLQPCTSYTWEARRVPYYAYQPVATAAPAVAAPACGCASACGSTCGTTAYYGATNWQPAASVSPATSCGSCQSGTTTTHYGYASASEFSPSATVAGYGPSEWTPVTSTTGAVTTSNGDAGCANCSVPTSSQTTRLIPSADPQTSAGATEWRTVTEGTSEAPSSQPADVAPRLNNNGSGTHSENYRPANEDRDRQQDTSSQDDYQDRYAKYRSESLRGDRQRDYRLDHPGDFERSRFYRERARHSSSAASEGPPPQTGGGWSYDDPRNRGEAAYDWRQRESSQPTDLYRPSRRTQLGEAEERTRSGPGRSPLLQPIPDLERDDQPWKIESTPQLIGPRDRTAALISYDRWEAIPSERPLVTSTARRPVSSGAQVTLGRPEFEEEGWRSMRGN